MYDSAVLPDVLDPAQLVRIEATHRGFLYQHLYAVACLLTAPRTGVRAVRVERDQDIELHLANATTYIQVKTRLDSKLMPSDLVGVLDAFRPIREAHNSGVRMGTPRFAVVSNASPGPALQSERAIWPADVALLTASDAPPGGLGLVAPGPTIEAMFALCVEAAQAHRLSAVRPSTLVWKLAAMVSAASAGLGSAREFKADELPALCEMVSAQLHPLPRIERYRPQRNEPDLAQQPHARLIVGHEGAGKSAWAAQVASHAPDLAIYFRCSDVPDEQLAPRLVREAIACVATRGLSAPHEMVLPGSTGLEALAMLDRHLATRGLQLLAIVDDAHRLGAETLWQTVSGTSWIRWIALGRPCASLETVAARLQTTCIDLGGWDDDTIAQVLAESSCSTEPAAVSDFRQVTRGAPLLVTQAVKTITRSAGGDVKAFVAALRNGALPARSPQEVLLGDAVARLSQSEARLASALASVDVAMAVESWLGLLPGPLAMDQRECGAAIRTLRDNGIVVADEQEELRLHDAFRPVFAPVLSATDRRAVQAEVAKQLQSVVLSSRSPERLLALFRVLRDLGRLSEIADVAAAIAEWTRELGVAESIYGLVDESLRNGNLSDDDRFWAEDTLAFFDVVNSDFDRAGPRLDRMKALLGRPALGTRHRAAFVNKSILALIGKGDIEAIRALVSEIPAEEDRQSRVLRYNVACAELRCGDAGRALASLLGLADDYLKACDLDQEGIFGVSVYTLARHLADKNIDIEDVRHAADCFDAVSKALREQGARGPAALWALWAFKFFNLAGAPVSLVRTGQDVADDLLGVVNDPHEARRLLENDLLPAVRRFGLAEHAIGVRAQLAVVCAHCGDFARAEAEMMALEPYVGGLAAEGRDEIRNQVQLIAKLKDRALQSRQSPRAFQQKVGRNEPCPCGSGKKFKKCCGQ